MKSVLLTSVCRPLGEKYGDAPSVGYELLFGQVTRAQGLFSPRSLHVHFSLEYIAQNLEAPTTVLQYPSKREFLRELKRGYEVIGVSFIMATFHKMKWMVSMIRKHSPGSEIVLGGYGTTLSDERLAPYGDHFCREEGVAFMRRLLGEPALEMPYDHPAIINPMKMFGKQISQTGVIFGGLGCANGCDFCCTSHFFKRKHIRLLPTGRDIYDVIEKYLKIDPTMSFIIIDEDFLLAKKRATEFRECVKEGGKALSIFCFASMRAISRYTAEEIVEMGIDGIWIGYEGTRSGFAKQDGKPANELFPELRAHGVKILSSMILGFPYQTPEIIEEEFQELMALKPSFTQFLIYGPVYGTPFYDRVKKDGTLQAFVEEDPEKYYWKGTGFFSAVDHPTMKGEEIEAIQKQCFERDFQQLGPSVFRTIENWIEGYENLRNSANPHLKRKAERYTTDIRKAYPIFLAGRLFGPNRAIRRRIKEMQREAHALLGRPTLLERVQAGSAVGLAAWTSFTLRMNLFQHPRLKRKVYRFDENADVAIRPPDVSVGQVPA